MHKKTDRKSTFFSTRKMAVLGLMATLALMISVLESALPNPIPIPGIRLGLSNIITLVVLQRYGTREALPVLLCRILLSCFFFSQAITLAYSLAGGLLCLTVMTFACRLFQKQYLWVTSIMGAIAHNTGQFLVALAITRTPGLFSWFPFLIISAILTGLFSGLCAHFSLQKLPVFPE